MRISVKRMLAWSPWLTDRYNYVVLLFQILSTFGGERNPWRIPVTSRDYYDAYGDKEQRMFAAGTLLLCRDGGRNRWCTYAEANSRYLAPIVREIEELLRTREAIEVLEVGCGNCINLIQLRKRFGARLKLHGIDISSGRLSVARKYFGEQLSDVPVWVESITEPVPEKEIANYDLVYSMHCLEQIPFAAAQAVEGLWRRARSRVVMVEPVWEFARPVQRLKLVRSDYIRTLLPTAKYLGYDILRAEPLGFESSQKNQSSVIVLAKWPTEH
jgi:SAM-dependent methyltransferase